MAPVIHPINLRMPLNLGDVNCYLIQSSDGFILIDTGSSHSRTALSKALSDIGCRPGNLKLIVLTHGDFDHTGNAASLRKEFGAPIAMHAADCGMVEQGNMFHNRQKSNPLLNFLASSLFGFGKPKRFKPDLLIDEDFDLTAYGVEAQILHIPGHSAGSIGILTPAGELICGDLFENVKSPALNSIMDDLKVAAASIEKLKDYKIETVYPGHGKSFVLDADLLVEFEII